MDLCYNLIRKGIPKGKQKRIKAKWGLFMTEQKKNTIITSGIVVLTVILAYCFRIVDRGSFYPMLFSYLRSFIYIGLFAAWGRASKEIGNEFGVSANLICAWVSKARKYLKSRPEILALAEI